MSIAARDIYESGAYAEQHSEWHAEDGPGKALDVLAGVRDAIRGKPRARILEVGCGTGAVLAALCNHFPEIHFVGSDIAEYAILKGREMHPNLDLRVENFLLSTQEFDAILFCDVLEHLENPFEFMRHAHKLAPTMIVRQPLQDHFGFFRNGLYDESVETLGHINYWNVRSFKAIARFCGWAPSNVEIVAGWHLKTGKARVGLLKRSLCALNPELASFFTGTYYLNGSFTRLRHLHQ